MTASLLAWLSRRRPWPATLRGRLIALLLAALVASQAIGLSFFFDERRLAVREALVGEALPRIANVAALLRDAPEPLHRRIINAARSPLVDFDIADENVAEAFRSARGTRRTRALVMDRLTRLLEDRTGDAWDGRVDVIVMGEGTWRRPFRADRGDDDDDDEKPYRRWWDDDDDAFDDDDWRENRRFDRKPPGPPGPPRVLGVVAAAQIETGDWLVSRVYFRRPPLQWAWPSIVSMMLTAVAIVVIVSATIWVGTRSLRELATAAERFGRGARGEPVRERGPLEARRLIVAFNDMQERLTRFVSDRTRLLASISHDLRTPITAMRIRAELIDDDETRTKIVDGLDEMQRMTEATLAFAKEEAAETALRSTDLSALVESVVEDFADLGAEATVSATERVVVVARPDALKRALRNLIENAVRYGGGARVGLSTTAEVTSITVDDDGPGVPADRIEAMFEPFARLETSRNRETGGVGLGLSIARSIARAHGGDVTLTNRSAGGLRAEIWLPTSGAGA